VSDGFLDTNIIVYHLTHTPEAIGERCTAFLLALAEGRRAVDCSSTAIHEATFVLERQFHVPRVDIASKLGDVVRIEAIHFDHRQAILDALDFWASQGPLSFADCYHLALAKTLGLDAVFSFDSKMDRYPGVARVEP
jgi:predicted nucleic acid-binding protein